MFNLLQIDLYDIIYIQRFTSVHLKPIFDLVYINLYNLYLLIYLLYVLYSASIRHVGISAIEKKFYYFYYVDHFTVCSPVSTGTQVRRPLHCLSLPVSSDM